MSFKSNDVFKMHMVSNHQWNVVEITYEYSDNDIDEEDDLKYELMDTFNNER